MNVRRVADLSLVDHPLWRAEDLGKPLPLSLHANSVCLPTWADVIGYEEGDLRVLNRLQTGYPRFFIHPATERLFLEAAERFAREDEFCHVYPSLATAQRCLNWVSRWTGLSGRIVAWSDSGPWVICFPSPAAQAAKKYWRHAGEGVSSRMAQACWQGDPQPDAGRAKQTVCERIAGLVQVPVDCVRLFGSGMSAIYAVHRAIQHIAPGRRSVQFGFPYVDTLKIQQDLGPGVHFFPRGDQQELGQLTDLLRSEAVSAIFCEFPSNPLLNSPDLATLADLSRCHDVPLVVDETLATYVNVDLRPWADVLVTSLTKYFTGVGDVLAGAVVGNPSSPRFPRLWDVITDQYEDLLWGDDALLLEQYSRDFPERMRQINRTAGQICQFCSSHPAILRVYYPSYNTPDHFSAAQRPDGGYGGLFSLLLKGAPQSAPAFFDALPWCKGPNLGTHFSLCCPFTMLAHFEELDWAEACGVSRYLLRFSTGLEPVDVLIDRLQQALDEIG